MLHLAICIVHILGVEWTKFQGAATLVTDCQVCEIEKAIRSIFADQVTNIECLPSIPSLQTEQDKLHLLIFEMFVIASSCIAG